MFLDYFRAYGFKCCWPNKKRKVKKTVANKENVVVRQPSSFAPPNEKRKVQRKVTKKTRNVQRAFVDSIEKKNETVASENHVMPSTSSPAAPKSKQIE